MTDRIGMALDLGAQALRVGWFFGVNQLVDRRTAALGSNRHYSPERPVPTRNELLGDLRNLMLRDAADVGAGRLPPTEINAGRLGQHLGRLQAMMRDLPEAVSRREERTFDTAKSAADTRPMPLGENGTDGESVVPLPDYFTQDFHYQTGGYLTDESAKIYDVQVETLFYGSAQLMRRVGVRHALAATEGKDQRKVALADIACGTGRFLRDIRRARPALKLTGVDLSSTYLDEARRHFGELRAAKWVQANAEALPFETESQDIVTSVFLFHELPPDVRHTVAAEFARVLKPGGTLVFIDSLQMGDRPNWDGLLEAFPVRFHEPYYRQYAIDPLEDIFTKAGLTVAETELAFLSKVVVARKPQD
ncbi:MAG: methyltransferase domain-containing protein [Pseudomonadota bacterium]